MHWLITDKGDPDARRLVDGETFGDGRPHYSRQTPGATFFTRNGQNLVFMTSDLRAVWCTFRPTPGKAVRTDHLDCWENALFRNEGYPRARASELIREAVLLSSAIWGLQPRDGFITFIIPEKIKSDVAGYSYRRAGWKHKGQTKTGKWKFVAPRAPVVALDQWEFKGARGGILREFVEWVRSERDKQRIETL